MGTEFRIRSYRVTFVGGKVEIIRCTQYRFKVLLRELKICGYAVIK